MTQEQSVEFYKNHPAIEQARPIWKHESYFTENAHPNNVTLVMCQKETKHATQLSIESILRFYPDIKVIVIDENSKEDDDSLLYLKYKEITTPNFKLVRHIGFNLGHGSSLDEAIVEHVKTEFVLIADSDIILERGGCIEMMLQRFGENSKLYSIGVLQYTSYVNNGGEPETPEDAIPYGNPQFSLYHVPTYHEITEEGTDSWGNHVKAPFLTDGTPCILNNKAAFDQKLEIEYFPMDKYLSHASGQSWTTPRTVWIDDHDVKVRPFLTIIFPRNINAALSQTDNDYDIVIAGENQKGQFIFTDGTPVFDVDSNLFPVRFNVHGEYIVDVTNLDSPRFPSDFINQVKLKAIEEKAPDEMEVYGFKIQKRKYWQSVIR